MPGMGGKVPVRHTAPCKWAGILEAGIAGLQTVIFCIAKAKQQGTSRKMFSGAVKCRRKELSVHEGTDSGRAADAGLIFVSPYRFKTSFQRGHSCLSFNIRSCACNGVAASVRI